MNKRLRLLVVLAAVATFICVATFGRASASSEIALPNGVPPELWSYFVPRDNPTTRDKVELGRELFFDKRLSSDGTVSCATCHNPELAFTDGKQFAEGVSGRRGTRNSPTVLNAMFNVGQFWDGRAQSLEAQATLPLINPDEMGNRSYDQVVARLRATPGYPERFRAVFGRAPGIDLVAKAISAFERTLVSGASPFDRFTAGERDALSDSALRGLALFRGRARCTSCHAIGQFLAQPYPFFSDGFYHNTGVAANQPDFASLAQQAVAISRMKTPGTALRNLAGQEGAQSLGRFLVTGHSLDIGAFRTPSLRNVELTAPYFHDGSMRTLADVVKFYVQGGKANPHRDWDLLPVNMTDDEQNDLIEFLKSLTSTNARRAGPL
jgi:cytochrome c peroxidase